MMSAKGQKLTSGGPNDSVRFVRFKPRSHAAKPVPGSRSATNSRLIIIA
jgi:hypothetical protein